MRLESKFQYRQLLYYVKLESKFKSRQLLYYVRLESKFQSRQLLYYVRLDVVQSAISNVVFGTSVCERPSCTFLSVQLGTGLVILT